MSSNPASELASAIQSVSLQHHPDPDRDINPSTAASSKIPADLVSPSLSSASASDDAASIRSDVIKPRPRKKSFPPIPDFRFEQSYLASLKDADTNWRVAYITIRDQVVLPLMQGMVWNLATFGWRHWNKGAKYSGQSVGARVRRWWWGVNNWTLPGEVKKSKHDERVGEVGEFFVGKFGSRAGD